MPLALPASFLVHQREFGLVRANTHKLIETTGFNSCIVVVLFSRRTGVAGLAHLDINTKVGESFERVILPALNGIKWGLTARLYGGLPQCSEQLAGEVRDALQNAKIPIQSMSIFSRDEWEGLSLDCETGKVEIAVPMVPPPAEARQRQEEYINHMLDNDGLLRFVAPPPDRPAPGMKQRF